MIIAQVPLIDVPALWPQISALFERVCKKRLQAPSTDDVRAHVMGRRWQLWAATHNSEIVAALCTGIVRERDGTKTLQLEQLAGDGIDWSEEMPGILAWGKNQGCVRARIPRGRPGWMRVFPGWWLSAVTLEKKEL